MPDLDDEVTELTALMAEKVSGVDSPANGTPWLMLKASGGDAASAGKCPLCHGTGKIRDGHMTCPKCNGTGDAPAEKSESEEADQIEEELTDETAKACGSDRCAVCAAALEKKKLTVADRHGLDDSDFAYIDSKGGRHLPIHDKAHVRAALGRFNQTQFESGKDKNAAAHKIKAKAKSLGIDVDDKSDVSQAAKSTGVPDAATETPKEGGHFPHTAQSGLSEHSTGGIKQPPADPSYALGGESSYEIPAEARANDIRNEPAPDHRPRAEATKAAVYASLAAAIEGIEAQREAAKAGGYMTLDNPTGQAATAPGSSPWESYDSATLDQVAECLAACGKAIDAIQQREAVEAVSGNPSDYGDAMDLSCAADALDAALGVVARLAYHEGAAAKNLEALVAKAGRRNSARDLAALRAARDHLTAVIGDGDDKENHKPSEEEDIMSAVTKEELAALVAESSASAVKAALKAERKRAKKNANNGGDITAAEMHEQCKGHADANDVNSIPDGGHVDGEYVNKKAEKQGKALKAMADQLKAATEVIGSLEEKVAKMAARPRPGGPILDGQPRGAYPASEQRLAETATKSEADVEIDRLQKALDAAPDEFVRESVGYQLTLARLKRAHELGQI